MRLRTWLRGGHHGAVILTTHPDITTTGLSMRWVAIYERAVGTPAFAAFAHQIATPIDMRDFDPARCRYVGGPDSIYPDYVVYASVRDLARFGLLYLRRGRADP
jgi:hypothetical protein